MAVLISWENHPCCDLDLEQKPSLNSDIREDAEVSIPEVPQPAPKDWISEFLSNGKTPVT